MSANFSKKMPNSLPWKWSMISEPNLILFSITLIGWTISQRAGMHNIVFPTPSRGLPLCDDVLCMGWGHTWPQVTK